MRILITVIFLTYFLGIINGQTQSSNYISIDHIPIVVENLDNLKKVLSETLLFKVKEGKEHEGIRNCFVKFEDGTYLEFTSPIDSSQKIGKYYADFLKNRQGGTALAISVIKTDILISNLKTKRISFNIDSNRIWKTIEPKGIDLFYIDYIDKQWKDSKINTTHKNTALSLISTYFLSPNINLDLKKYKLFGFRELKNGRFSNIPYKHLLIGNSNLYLLDTSKSKGLMQKLNNQSLVGICGFEIKTKSLSMLNKLVEKVDNVTIEKNQTTIYLKDLNIFFVFRE